MATNQSSRQPRSTTAPTFVERPVQTNDRSFQIGQVKRRFNAKEETTPAGDVILSFGMAPSDPDFPFDIDELKCVLRVPAGFLGRDRGRRPTLRITNKQMERGYQINVENGFDRIWTRASAPTLLHAMKQLDKELEAVLMAKKAETVTFVANSRPPHTDRAVPSTKEATSAAAIDPVAAVKPRSAVFTQPPVSSQRREEARVRREHEVQMLEHRLGRDPQFSKAAGDTLFTISIEPRKRKELPMSLQALKIVHLLVSSDYDIGDCTVELVGVPREDAVSIEAAFLRRSRMAKSTTLLAQINYLASSMHLMAKEPVEEKVDGIAQHAPVARTLSDAETKPDTATETSSMIVKDTDKEHVKVVSRPPEWDLEGQDEESDSDDEEYSSLDDSDSDSGVSVDNVTIEDADKIQEPVDRARCAPECGVMISFPGLALHGIELLEMTLVHLTVKCERCKEQLDVQRIRPQESPDDLGTLVSISCKKCVCLFAYFVRSNGSVLTRGSRLML